ncbi:MAG TPA: M20/M25/M40 family metallo-hydrolase [Caulobacteraceae bacterium]|jgi:Zn-dependent M28 family amino/carboxypeptidase|nr:M20/M25/M40 family metallo-hydrolase [Caulobacteraceae bacterium]
MRLTPLIAGLTLAAASTLAVAAAVPPAHRARAATGPARKDHALLHTIAGDVSAARLHATIAKLVSFGTRSTISETTSDTRGIGAARRWVKSQFEDYSHDCGGCLEIVTPSEMFSGKRYDKPTEVMDVVAIQRGTGDPDRVVVITGHLDSRNSDTMNTSKAAPGANDDASGVAALMEAARVLSKHKFAATIVYSADSGEEQGLDGGKVIVDYAKAHGWRVEADLNNDIIGNSHGMNGVHDDTHVRVFSEGTKAVETDAEAARRRYNGGELDSPSRNLARYMEDLSARYVQGLSVKMIYRTDRYGRGGDQVRFLAEGYPAVRVTESAENYHRQHQDVRVENGIAYGDVISGVDFPYLAKVTRLNAVTLASLAAAPAPPEDVKIEGGVSDDTTMTWKAARGAADYRVWWRATTEPTWSHVRSAGNATTLKLDNVIIDDWFFGVSSVSADGWESPVEYPGPAGSFVSASPPTK